MRSFDLRIAIISQDAHLYLLFSDMVAQGAVTPQLTNCGDLWQEAAKTAHIIVLELPHCARPEQVRALCRADAQLVVCADAAGLAGLSEVSAQAADAFWTKPQEDRVALLQLAGLIKNARMRRQLELNTMFLDALTENMPDMVWFKDLDGAHVKVNDAFCHIVGKPKQEITGRDHCYIWDVSKEEFEHGEFVCKETDQFVLEHRAKCFSAEKVKSQHGMRQFNTYKAPLICADGTLWGSVGIGHDVTILENMGTELQIILRSMPFAILVWNEEGVVIDANDKFEEYFGIDGDSIIGKLLDDRQQGVLQTLPTANSERYLEAKIIGAGARQERIVEIHEEAILDMFHNEVGKLRIYRDITKERELEHTILKSSNTDFLTGLYNRRCFYQFVRENRGTQPISLLYVDLDRFKLVNDTYGHQAGDEALILTARLLRECFSGDFIARIGGDEFLVAILGARAPEMLEQKSQCLIDRMQQVFSAHRSFEMLSASVGIAQSDDPSDNIDLLIQRSDSALYAAKSGGRSRCCFYDPSM